MTKRITGTQLIHYLDALYDCLDQKIPFSCVYFDFAKAFDTVPHDLLIKKLPSFGFDRNITMLLAKWISTVYYIGLMITESSSILRS